MKPVNFIIKRLLLHVRALVLPADGVVDGTDNVLDEGVDQRQQFRLLKDQLPLAEVTQRRRPRHDLRLPHQVEAHLERLRRGEEPGPAKIWVSFPEKVVDDHMARTRTTRTRR